MAAIVKEIELNEPPKDGISALVFSPTGHLLLATSWDCSIRVYDTTSNGLSHLSYSKAPVLDACFGDANSTVFSGGLDREVTQLDLATGAKRVVGGHAESVKSVLFSHSHRASRGLKLGGYHDTPQLRVLLLCRPPRLGLLG